MAYGVAEEEATGTQAKEHKADRGEGGWPQGEFPVAPDWLLYRLKDRSAA